MMNKQWDIREKEKFIIEAVINFGDWLQDHPLALPEQKEAIRSVQKILKHLPGYQAGFNGGYECTIDSPYPETEGVYRCWWVEIFKDVLSIGNVYTPYPEVDESEQSRHEWEYEIQYGHKASVNFGMENWVKEISQIEHYLTRDFYLEVGTDLNSEYLLSDQVLFNGQIVIRSDIRSNQAQSSKKS
ncbi:MAG: hypothetical protein GY729_13090 [Desulfobacteraceae bacterium]|nr:hypothetical protein [Desulfobacteraceae bacterium]